MVKKIRILVTTVSCQALDMHVPERSMSYLEIKGQTEKQRVIGFPDVVHKIQACNLKVNVTLRGQRSK